MSEQNVQIVRAVYERFGAGDFSASKDLLDPHAVLVLSGAVDWGPETPASGIYVGAEAIAAYTREFLLGPWEGFTMEADEILEAGDSVLVGVRQSGVSRASRLPAELRYFTLWSFRGDQVIRIESFRDRRKALDAAGLTRDRRDS